MSNAGKYYRPYLIRLVKAAGRDITDMAEQIVGETRGISDLSIWLRFPQDGGAPTIEIQREHIGTETLKAFLGGESYDEEDGN